MPDVMEHIEGGNFSQELQDNPAVVFGADFAKTGAFKNAKNVSTLIKNHLNLEQERGRLAQQVQNSIPKLKDNASDEERATHKKSLMTALGVPAAAADYKIRPDQWPEDVPVNEDYENHMREFAFKNGIPKFIVDMLGQEAGVYSLAARKTSMDAEEVAYGKAWDELESDKDWTGDNLNVKIRQAIKAMLELSTNAKLRNGLAKQDLTEKDGKAVNPDGLDMYTTPSDRAKWKKLGIWPNAIRQWQVVGAKMGPGRILPNQVAGGGAVTDQQKDIARAKARYTHGTSQELIRRAEGG